VAGASLLTLLDDVASLLDDVATLTKVAAQKTTGVLGDDLALNAEQVTGVDPDRELPVVWAVFKGSALNKVILVPIALALSALAPWAILPLLMLGGAFLCFEGFEKVAHALFHSKDDEVRDAAEHAALVKAVANEKVDLVAFEREKIRGAIRTDLVLSAEIIVISLGVVADEPLLTRGVVLSLIAAAMTVGVYGFVAGIVKLDDAGLALTRRDGATSKSLGRLLVRVAPWLMKGLALAGTIAMFLVGGGILVHGIPWLHHISEAQGGLVQALMGGATGVVAGGLIVALVTLVHRIRGERSEPKS
jgi:predicted DNA repair protein MutK